MVSTCSIQLTTVYQAFHCSSTASKTPSTPTRPTQGHKESASSTETSPRPRTNTESRSLASQRRPTWQWRKLHGSPTSTTRKTPRISTSKAAWTEHATRRLLKAPPRGKLRRTPPRLGARTPTTHPCRSGSLRKSSWSKSQARSRRCSRSWNRSMTELPIDDAATRKVRLMSPALMLIHPSMRIV